VHGAAFGFVEVAVAVAALIVGIPAAVVSAFTPRFDAQLVLDDNDPPHGDTGPDPEDECSGSVVSPTHGPRA